MLALLVLFASVQPKSSPDAASALTKGAALYGVCRAEVRLMDLPTLSDATQQDVMDGSYCMGYLNGFTGSLYKRESSICTHEESMGSLVRVYVTFMDQNPNLLDEDRTVGLRLALKQAYPCPANTEPSPVGPPPSARRSL